VVETTSLGNVDLSDAKGDNASGFFAQSYVDQTTGQKIISYRGTDFAPTSQFLKDGLNGWTVGVGVFTAAQAQFAAQFFQEVAGNGATDQTLSDLYNSNILLTGHSLGGGLAGFVANLYQQQSAVRIFDPMAFALAAQRALVAAQDVMLYDSEGQEIGMGADAFVQQVRDTFFRGEKPTVIGSSSIGSYSVSGQVISPGPFPTGWVAASSSLLLKPEYDLGFSGILSGSDRHSQSLLVIRMFADVSGLSNDWLAASKYVLTKLFNDSLAQALGLVTAGGTGASSASDKWRAMIAYSAIDDGECPLRRYRHPGLV